MLPVPMNMGRYEREIGLINIAYARQISLEVFRIEQRTD